MTKNSLQKFIGSFPKRRSSCKIDNIEFWIDPQSIDWSHEYYHQEVGTRTGFGRWNYGPKPAVIRLSGTTGTAGFKGSDERGREIGGIDQLSHFMPLVGHQSKPVYFEWPVVFRGKRTVYVNLFNLRMTNDAPYYPYFDIELMEINRQNAVLPIIQQTGQGIAIGLTVTPIKTPATRPTANTVKPSITNVGLTGGRTSAATGNSSGPPPPPNSIINK